MFQNRYKSLLCEEDHYLLELVRYIHLNPLRAGIVDEIKALNINPYCGHSVIMGNIIHGFHNIDYVLNLFGEKIAQARGHYLEFVLAGGKQRKTVTARSVLCYWATRELGMSAVAIKTTEHRCLDGQGVRGEGPADCRRARV
ncbi:hypothetical protein DSCO28_39470 [Desulfosarcina ovata subsp. sediminis]|uniref:Transposase IS200-like domain-containing protein n=1 Tax=Desulfosarcina ovata subsp. sediminis TaxID=885957 RepID=A0A5K7ZT27_9BACT|nr:hypothetical protein DSCO28_39470 [Desulfosarcina ovata subsp. sediminis]